MMVINSSSIISCTIGLRTIIIWSNQINQSPFAKWIGISDHTPFFQNLHDRSNHANSRLQLQWGSESSVIPRVSIGSKFNASDLF
jgi:hypothetical protein